LQGWSTYSISGNMLLLPSTIFCIQQSVYNEIVTEQVTKSAVSYIRTDNKQVMNQSVTANNSVNLTQM
jgi:hypothetical protein